MITWIKNRRSLQWFTRVSMAIAFNIFSTPDWSEDWIGYTKTVFEWTTDKLGAQATVCGGGRYDDLVKQLGGKDVFAIGCAIGFERLVELVELSGKKDQNGHPKIYLVAVGDQAEAKSSELAEMIDQFEDCVLELNQDGGSFKQQFKRADRAESDIALILGDEEIENDTIGIKLMKEGGDQETISQDKFRKHR